MQNLSFNPETLSDEWMSIQEKMIKWRRDLHRMPELGLETPRSAEYIREVLGELGIFHESYLGGSAAVGLIEGEAELPEGRRPGCIALRADIDGLPVCEETGLPFASENGNMHACGHDAHAAMLLGAAAYLQARRSDFAGSVKLLFQPGEEKPGGAKPMIAEGCLRNPDAEAVFGLHCGQISRELPRGKIGLKDGALMASVDAIKITLRGRGGHAGYPEDCRDPLPGAASLILSLQSLISREIKPGDPAVLSLTAIQGGDTFNVIPDTVTIQGTARNTVPETRERLARRLREMAEGIAQAYGLELELDHRFIYPILLNDKGFTAVVREALGAVFPEDLLYELNDPVMAGEDFSCYAEEVPSCFAFMSNPAPVGGVFYPHHASRFDVDEGAFVKGAMAHAAVSLHFLKGGRGKD